MALYGGRSLMNPSRDGCVCVCGGGGVRGGESHLSSIINPFTPEI